MSIFFTKISGNGTIVFWMLTSLSVSQHTVYRCYLDLIRLLSDEVQGTSVVKKKKGGK